MGKTLFSFLKSKKLASAVWIFGGYGAAQLIRLSSNLVLTRLLVPEMFGLMLLVNAVLLGLNLFSDIGIRDSIINTKGESNHDFLKTAWTLQILRGCVVFLIAFAAAVPLESYYGYEGLATLLMVCSTTAIIDSCSSVNLYVLHKKLEFRPEIILDAVTSLFGAMIMITAAYFYQSVWSLVLGMVSQSIFKAVLTHMVIPGPKMGFGFNVDVVKKMVHFGKWIFLSTATMYISWQGDKLILGKTISPAELGVYSIAIAFGLLFKEFVAKLSHSMLMPVFRLMVEGGESYRRIIKIRLPIILFAFISSLILTVMAEAIISFLYDDRYNDAGWMFQILIFVGFLHSFDDTIRGFLLANRDSYHSFCIQAIKSMVFLLLALSFVQHLGLLGILIAMAMTPLLSFPFLASYVHAHGYVWCYIDAVIMVLTTACFIAVWWIQDGTVWKNIVGVFL